MLDIKNLDKELYVAEYNFEQQCFHHGFLQESLETNLKCIKLQQNNPWIIFAIGTWEETNQAINLIREIWKN